MIVMVVVVITVVIMVMVVVLKMAIAPRVGVDSQALVAEAQGWLVWKIS